MKKPPQSAPAKGAAPIENRSQPSHLPAGSAKVKTPPRSKADADSKLMGGDGELAKVSQSLDPPHRLEMPGDLTEPTAHGHSPEIKWPSVASDLPFKNLK